MSAHSDCAPGELSQQPTLSIATSLSPWILPIYIKIITFLKNYKFKKVVTQILTPSFIPPVIVLLLLPAVWDNTRYLNFAWIL